MQCDYECLDAIADAVNPALVLIALTALGLSRSAKGYGRRSWAIVCAAGIATVYTVQWLDGAFSIWSSWGGDYSSHTAFAVAIVFGLAVLAPSWAMAAGGVLAFYVALMLYQRYHTWVDILTSSAPIAWMVVVVHRVATRRRREDSIADGQPDGSATTRRTRQK
jgi:hypothetical protein